MISWESWIFVYFSEISKQRTFISRKTTCYVKVAGFIMSKVMFFQHWYQIWILFVRKPATKASIHFKDFFCVNSQFESWEMFTDRFLEYTMKTNTLVIYIYITLQHIERFIFKFSNVMLIIKQLKPLFAFCWKHKFHIKQVNADCCTF